MPEPNKVKLSALMDERRKRAPLRLADLSTNIEKSVSQQAIKKLLESNFMKAGFDLDKLGALLKQSDAEARQRLVNLKAEADRQAPATLVALHRTVENLSNRVKLLTTLALPDAPAQYVLLDTATEISATSEITLNSTHIGSENNWAKFYHDASVGDTIGVGGGEVSFGFLWQNPSDRTAVVNVDGYMLLNAFCSVFSDGGFLVISPFSKLWVDTCLFIHELWNEPPTSPMWQDIQSQNKLVIECDTFGIAQPGQVNGGPLFRGSDLSYSQFVLPPKGVAMFEVACILNYLMSNGQTQSDFSFHDRQLLCPGVLISEILFG